MGRHEALGDDGVSFVDWILDIEHCPAPQPPVSNSTRKKSDI